MTLLARLGTSIAAVITTAVVIAIAAAIIDMYLTGHGHPSIMRVVVSWPAAGVSLSIPDIVLLVASIAAGILTWRSTEPGRQ